MHSLLTCGVAIVVSLLRSWLLILKIPFAFKSAVAGARRHASTCSSPIFVSISPGASSSCLHPVPADDFVAQEHPGVVFVNLMYDTVFWFHCLFSSGYGLTI
jgi:hypothetical protein